MKPPGSERAVALIIVMISIFVLTILAGGFAYSMKVETRLARNVNSEPAIEWLGRSAVECARWELVQYLKTPQKYDSLNQPWAGGSDIASVSNSPLDGFEHVIEMPGGRATWKIVDLERKLNINTVSEPVLQQALTSIGVDAGDTTPIVNSILDWVDADDNHRIQGAEKEDYRPEGYAIKNGPIDHLSELLLVKNVTPELYWGTSSTNYPALPSHSQQNRRQAAGQPQTYSSGLVNLFTPLSRGSININTASSEVLQSLPGMDPISAQAIVSGRDGEDDGTGMFGPYPSVAAVTRSPDVARYVPGLLQQNGGDVRSYTFEVQVEATVNGYTRHFTSVLGRTPNDCLILTFNWND